jgi:all-trans-retinol 13,14-reductase
MRADTVIIGSGISALTAAALLSKKGIDVLVLEKERRIGGALKQFKRKGVPFDVGFHYSGCLGENEILHRIWKYCGVLKNLEILPFPEHGSDRLYLQNHEKPVDAYFSYERFTTELQQFFPKEKKAISTYFEVIRSICRRIPFYNQELSVSDFLRDFRNSKRSVRTFLEEITKDTALQSVLASPALLYGIPTENVSIDIHAMVAHGFYRGAYSIRGGGQAIVDAFVHACTAYGASFLPSMPVSAIEFDDSGVTGVITESHRKIACRRVIYSGHPTNLMDLIDGKAFRLAFKKRLLQLKNTISMNILFGTMKHPPESMEWHNHIFLPDGPDPLANTLKKKAGNRLLMATSTERGSFSLRQDYKSVILMQPACWDEVKMFEHSDSGSRPALYQAYKHEISTAMIAQAEKYLGKHFSDIKPLEAGTPLTFRDELSAPQGCAYGASHSLDQHTPDIRTKVPGLYLSGQSTIMTGIVGASIAGLLSAGHITGLDSLWDEIRSCN